MTTKTRNITFMPSGSSRSRSICGLLAAGLGVFLGNPRGSEGAIPYQAVITADNAYGFGDGDVNGICLSTGCYMPGSCNGTSCDTGPLVGTACTGSGLQPECSGVNVENCTAAEIFQCPPGNPPNRGPETYYSSITGSGYVFIAAWSDKAVTQGVIATFRNSFGGLTDVTGAGWEVCATGVNFNACDGGPLGPDLATINAQIAICNAGTGGPGSSGGWVDEFGAGGGTTGFLFIGEDNSSPGGTFQQVCTTATPPLDGMDPSAKWIWYTSTGSDPLSPGGNHQEFLIFRRAGGAVTIPSAPAVSAWGVGALALLLLTGTAIKFGRRRAATA